MATLTKPSCIRLEAELLSVNRPISRQLFPLSPSAAGPPVSCAAADALARDCSAGLAGSLLAGRTALRPLTYMCFPRSPCRLRPHGPGFHKGTSPLFWPLPIFLLFHMNLITVLCLCCSPFLPLHAPSVALPGLQELRTELGLSELCMFSAAGSDPNCCGVIQTPGPASLALLLPPVLAGN